MGENNVKKTPQETHCTAQAHRNGTETEQDKVTAPYSQSLLASPVPRVGKEKKKTVSLSRCAHFALSSSERKQGEVPWLCVC